tara:strand:- start:193 stop:663 length:471 start_codon:yes stop_codon:yes gene_type:complete
MKKEFVPYEESLALKELGFDEPCFAGYNFKDRRTGQFKYPSARDANTTSKARVYADDKKIVGAPLYQQAFRWFREKYKLVGTILGDGFNGELKGYYYSITEDGWINYYESIDDSKWFDTYQEAELACLRKLIDIVNQNKEDGNKTNTINNNNIPSV